MIKQQQFYVLKLTSSRLKDAKYNIKNMTTDYAREHKELIALGDNQMLKTLRKLTGNKYDFEELIKLRKEKKLLTLQNNGKNKTKIKELQKKIDNIIFIPEYVSVVVEKFQHYDRMFKSGFKINGEKYKRISCSASQARVNTVIFIQEKYCDDLKRILDNEREDNPIVPNKYNAYFGLNSSSIYEVTRPKVCVVSDKEIEMVKRVDFITENENGDSIKDEYKKLKFNLFDGQGICSVRIAKQWAKDLKLLNKQGEVDYIPSYFIGRSNWIKGAFFTFDIHKFAKDIAHKDTVKDIYNITHNIEDIDVFVSESQFKLHGSYKNWDDYIDKCEKNGLVWGVSRVCPKYIDEYTTTNYQFVQTTEMNDEIMKQFLQPTIDWIEKVLNDDPIYTTLFLNGSFKLDEDIMESLNRNNNPYVKAIIYNHKMLKDNEIKNEIYRNIKKKIKELMIGKVLIQGNFSMMASDMYAQCEHIFGMKVNGLLKEREYYSVFWNKKNVSKVDAMRSPLTFYSEHNILDLKNNDDMREWYKYQYGSIIYNVWGTDCIQHADSDWDGDIVCTTSNEYMINGVRTEFLPITYDKKTADKAKVNDELLYKSDKDSFFSTIGSVTNVSTSFYAMLPIFEKDSKEYKEILKRLKILRKEQGNAIDKAKGIQVKPFNKTWINCENIDRNKDCEEEIVRKEFNNSICANKKPYFMFHLYKHCKADYDKHFNVYDTYSQIKFDCGIKDLINKENRTDEENQHVSDYYLYMPLLNSDCLMNKICWYVEKINEEKFKIKNNTMTYETIDLMMDKTIPKNETMFKKVEKIYEEFKSKRKDEAILNTYETYENDESEISNEIDNMNESFRNKLLSVCSNIKELANYAVELDYLPRAKDKRINKVTANKDFTWKLCADGVLSNIKSNGNGKIIIPILNNDGNIEYLGKRFSATEVKI